MQLARSRWNTLSKEQLVAVAQARCILGQDGTDLAEEVLPGGLVRRMDAAWRDHCTNDMARLGGESAGGGSSGDAAGLAGLWEAAEEAVGEWLSRVSSSVWGSVGSNGDSSSMSGASGCSGSGDGSSSNSSSGSSAIGSQGPLSRAVVEKVVLPVQGKQGDRLEAAGAWVVAFAPGVPWPWHSCHGNEPDESHEMPPQQQQLEGQQQEGRQQSEGQQEGHRQEQQQSEGQQQEQQQLEGQQQSEGQQEGQQQSEGQQEGQQQEQQQSEGRHMVQREQLIKREDAKEEAADDKEGAVGGKGGGRTARKKLLILVSRAALLSQFPVHVFGTLLLHARVLAAMYGGGTSDGGSVEGGGGSTNGGSDSTVDGNSVSGDGGTTQPEGSPVSCAGSLHSNVALLIVEEWAALRGRSGNDESSGVADNNETERGRVARSPAHADWPAETLPLHLP